MNEEQVGFIDFVKLVISALEAADIKYMIGGAIASWAWGEPRSTMDVDLVVDIPIESINGLSHELKLRDMLVPAEIILDNILENRVDHPINAIHIYSGFKADLYPFRVGDELRASALARKRLADLGPELGEVYLHSPEDLVIYKLWCFSLSRQTKHLRDMTAILHSQGEDLDYQYIKQWVGNKGLDILWDEFLKEFRSRQ
ncbi:MAG: hypothetical protein V2J62_10520 [candidate division KSB1 bacterium]|jgi:hypothetical protein|nr:hypothetical protein [candidate division KSB1 bacterium]